MSRRRRDGLPARGKREVRLTPLLIKNLKSETERYYVYDTQQKGLVVRIEPTGTKTYWVIYRFGGKPRWYHIGDTRAIDLGDDPNNEKLPEKDRRYGARTLAARVLYRVIGEGVDVAAEAKAERMGDTFGELAARYVVEHAKKRNKSWEQAKYLVDRHLIPKWADLQFHRITRQDAKTALGRIDKPSIATQVKACGGAIFSWAIKQSLAKDNPFKLIDTEQSKKRQRVLSSKEIPQFWQAFDKHSIHGKALKLTLLLGQRPGEVLTMRWEHVVDNWWCLPGEAIPALRWRGTKNEANHRVWIPQAARELMGEEGSKGFVLAGPKNGGIGNLDAVMRDICLELGITAPDMDPETMSKAKVTPHDCRRTHGTTITGLGFGRDAMNRIQNHIEGGIADVYDQHGYQDENRQIMEAASIKIMGWVAGKDLDKKHVMEEVVKLTGVVDGDKVVAFRRERKSA